LGWIQGPGGHTFFQDQKVILDFWHVIRERSSERGWWIAMQPLH
jgi:hypothetical protein